MKTFLATALVLALTLSTWACTEIPGSRRTGVTIYTCETNYCGGAFNRGYFYTQQCTHWCCQEGGGQYDVSTCIHHTFTGYCCDVNMQPCAPNQCGEGACSAYPSPSG